MLKDKNGTNCSEWFRFQLELDFVLTYQRKYIKMADLENETVGEGRGAEVDAGKVPVIMALLSTKLWK